MSRLEVGHPINFFIQFSAESELVFNAIIAGKKLISMQSIYSIISLRITEILSFIFLFDDYNSFFLLTINLLQFISHNENQDDINVRIACSEDLIERLCIFDSPI